MSRRIDIELTSARPDGTWTWRAAGAQQPRGVVAGDLLPTGAAVGSVFRADADHDVDGITILSVATVKEREGKGNLLELKTSEKPFEPVTQQLAKRDRPDRRSDDRRGPRRDGDRRGPRRDAGPGAADDGRSARGPRPERGARPERGPRPERRPRFEAPPELPQRPKAKRLRPGRAHRDAALATLGEAERVVAEPLLQGGIPAVRQAIAEQNRVLREKGEPTVDEKGLLKLAEDIQPALRVAEWRDRADAALSDVEHLDLRDLRSVVVAADDPMVARDESTRELATTLKASLASRQERELELWLADIDAALGVGRVVRALKLSSQPPKAGVRFPAELAARLATATSENLTADALAERWVAVLEAAAFSPVRQQVRAAAPPTQSSDELLATVRRLAPALPQIAAVFGIEVDRSAVQPKPLRPTRPAPRGPKRPPAPAG